LTTANSIEEALHKNVSISEFHATNQPPLIGRPSVIQLEAVDAKYIAGWEREGDGTAWRVYPTHLRFPLTAPVLPLDQLKADAWWIEPSRGADNSVLVTLDGATALILHSQPALPAHAPANLVITPREIEAESGKQILSENTDAVFPDLADESSPRVLDDVLGNADVLDTLLGGSPIDDRIFVSGW
jgi:hypothetical protein